MLDYTDRFVRIDSLLTQVCDGETEMVDRILTGAAGAVVATFIIFAISKFTDWITFVLAPAVPSGAVVAFDVECKDLIGWEDYTEGAGKFLLGAGDGTLQPSGPHRPPSTNYQGEVKLTPVKLGDQGGEETHKLTDDEIPIHDHQDGDWKYLVRQDGKGTTSTKTDTKGNEINIKQGAEVKPFGKGLAHNNMPPYIAMHFCKKTR